MNKELDFLQNLFGGNTDSIHLPTFIVGMLVTTLLALALSFVYVRYGTSLSNRKALARTFILISLTTMLIITIVKSSLALSLGLVGALSIVRFRTAIKEPEELAYFFMAIAIGLGIGANQIIPTLTGSLCIFIVIFVLNFKQSKDVVQNLVLQFDAAQSKADLEKIISILEENCIQVELRRMDESKEFSEVSFAVGFKGFPNLLTLKDSLQNHFPKVTFSFLEIV